VRQESKHEIIATLRGQYRAAGRVEKERIIAEVVLVTGYHPRYAQTLLREGVPYRRPRLRRGGRPPTYGPESVRVLTVAAEATGWICGKRLAAALPDLIPALERAGALVLTDDLRTTVCALNAATSDRRLAAVRRQQRPRGLTTTKPGSLLKSQVPIRTYTPWDEEAPGFLEIDLVAHCRTTTAGEYVHTLDATDIATGWTECAALANKSQRSVLAALQTLRERFPFPVRGIDSDNGSAFLTAHLLRYCTQEELTFTRCRAYHKNDQAHVEQKNWSVVRQLIGYDRYEGADAVAHLNCLYALLHPYLTGYLPTMKLSGKERDGARVRKHDDQPRTPYRRAEQGGVLVPPAADAFAALLAQTGPLTLRRQIEAALAALWPLRVRVKGPTALGQTA